MTEPLHEAELPPLRYDPSFYGMTLTQFLGAFNDNLFKQLILLLAVSAAVTDGDSSQIDLQSVAMFVFSLPFVLLSGFAGFLSDRYSKRLIIVASKAAEIVVMLFGVVAFFFFDVSGYLGLFIVLALMGSQSAFFGPGKYGILPELFRKSDLKKANGWIQMTTFMAIIFGVAIAGVLLDTFENQMAKVSSVCVGIAILGTLTSLLVRHVPVAQPNLKFQKDTLTIPKEIRQLLRNDHHLATALLVSSLFWLVAGISQPAVNSLGAVQLELSKSSTSLLAAIIGVGIAVGCAISGFVSKGKNGPKVVKLSAWGLIGSLILLSLPAFGLREHNHLLGFEGSIPLMFLLGIFTGMFVIPVQVILQMRPPKELKGRTIATMNLLNFIGIFLSSLSYFLMDLFLIWMELPRCGLFFFMAVLMLPIAICYQPSVEASELELAG